MKKLNTKLTIPKVRTVCKYQQNQNGSFTNNVTDPATTTATISGVLAGGW